MQRGVANRKTASKNDKCQKELLPILFKKEDSEDSYQQNHYCWSKEESQTSHQPKQNTAPNQLSA